MMKKGKKTSSLEKTPGLEREKSRKKGKNSEIRGVLEKGPYLAYIEISLSEILI